MGCKGVRTPALLLLLVIAALNLASCRVARPRIDSPGPQQLTEDDLSSIPYGTPLFNMVSDKGGTNRRSNCTGTTLTPMLKSALSDLDIQQIPHGGRFH